MPEKKPSVELSELTAISPLDGRYWREVCALGPYFGDGALNKYRVRVEIEYLISLSECPAVEVREVSEEEKDFLRNIYKNFTEDDANLVKKIDDKIQHDVKAIEMFLREKLKGTSLEDILEYVHFAITSEDISNIAFSLMIKDALNDVVLPSLEAVEDKLIDLADTYKDIAMLGRTHGKPASTTTVGKEFANFASKLGKEIGKLKREGIPHIEGKMGGAVGNLSTHVVTYPQVDWIEFGKEFVEKRFGLVYSEANTQILAHESISDILRRFVSLNNVMTNFEQDMWRYISDEWFKLKVKEGEVGSSVMPQKVNPRHFENAEGNLEFANIILSGVADKLQISRLQRDLSDFTVKRNYGVPFGHSLLAYKMTSEGLSRMVPDIDAITSALKEHPEVIAEAIQTILRREGIANPYDAVKELTRGKKVTKEELNKFVDAQPISDEAKEQLKQLLPENYTGYAKRITERVVGRFRKPKPQ